MTRRSRFLLQGGALVVVAAVVAALVVVATRRTGPPELPSQPLQVGLQAPSAAVVGASVPVLVSAAGADPLARIEVWAGNSLVAARELADVGTAELVTLPWLVETAGTTTLVARAFDAAGRVGVSNSVTVAVQPGLAVDVLGDDQAGSTLASLADGDPELTFALNPGIDPDQPLEAGMPVLLPVPKVPGAGGAQPSPVQQLDLTGSASGCDAALTVTGLTPPDNRPEGWSVEVYRHLPHGAGSVLVGVATEGGTEVTLVDHPGPGTHVYSAAEYSAGDTSVTPLVTVAVGDCPGGGAVTISQGILHIGEPVDGVFLYLSANGGSYRVPADPAELITGDGFTFDLRPFLPPLPDTDITVEIWGRRAGGVVLLGTLVLTPEALLSPSTTLHGLWDVFLQPEPIPVTKLPAFADDTVEFRWSSTVAHSGVRWFLARSKPGPATVLNPIGVAQSGIATPDGDGHRFTIDLSKNKVPSVVPVQFDTLMAGAEFASLPVSNGGPSPSTAVPADEPGTTWVWAVPVDGSGAPVGPASNLVQLVLKPPPYDPTKAPPYDIVEIKVHVPPAPNPELRGCVRIVSETPGFPTFVNGLGVYLDGSPVPTGGGTIKGTLPYTYDEYGRALYPFTACPGEKGTYKWGGGASGSFLNSLGTTVLNALESAFESVVAAVNWISSAYTYLKTLVVSTIADVLCPSEVKAKCQVLVEIAVDAALASVGIPPSLPDFDKLANLAKGELVNLALDQLGISEACDAVATSVTGKDCGAVVAALVDNGACALAPKGQEQTCQEQLAIATDLCTKVIDHAGCEIATKNARDIVEAGMGKAYDMAVELGQQKVTAAMMEALTGIPAHLYEAEHGCHWGGIDKSTVVCPPTTWYSRAGCTIAGGNKFHCPPGAHYGPRPPSCTTLSGATPVGGGTTTKDWLVCTEESFGTLPKGCSLTYDYDPKGPHCTKPPPERVAIPEPRGHHQPIRVDVKIQRNGNPLPADFQCGPITAEVTTLTPDGAVGQPYLPATASTRIVYDPAYEAGWVQQQQFTLWLHEPNPFVVLDKPELPAWVTEMKGVLDDTLGSLVSVTNSDWAHLLAPGSLVGVKVYGDCVGEKYAGEGSFGVVGKIPPPLPRITPGSKDAD